MEAPCEVILRFLYVQAATERAVGKAYNAICLTQCPVRNDMPRVAAVVDVDSGPGAFF